MPNFSFPRIVVLTGAGISAESGLPTFRGEGGLWRGQRVEELASPRAFRDQPEQVHAFYNWRRRALLASQIQPNPAHFALVELERLVGPARFHLVTQNIDDLHERAGARGVHHLHGELLKARCSETGETWPWREDLSMESPHPSRPDLRGTLRPHVVWFGEQPLRLPEIHSRLQACQLFISIGTSGVVYPAAGFVQVTPASCRRIELNLDETARSEHFHEHRRGLASEVVPALVRELREQWEAARRDC